MNRNKNKYKYNVVVLLNNLSECKMYIGMQYNAAIKY